MLTAACTANMLPIISSIKNEALVSIQISESARIPDPSNMSVHHYECVVLCFVNILQRARS